MSLRATPRRRAVPALGLAAVALLAGCGVGQQAMTYNERPTVDGTNTMVGQIAVRDLAVSLAVRRQVLRRGERRPGHGHAGQPGCCAGHAGLGQHPRGPLGPAGGQ